MLLRHFVLVFLVMLSLFGCQSTETHSNSKKDPYTPEAYVKVKHPEWSKNAVLYQLNTRQFTEEGTFVAAAAQLPRLKELGIDIIWLMPVNPIGELNRKGTLGSPYSVKDYYGVNPEFGSLDDLKSFVDQAHRLGMKVILDWVANHTAWDNDLRMTHPEWYQRDYKGDFRPTPWWDWSDIINLDYTQPGIREYMTDVMKYWVQEVDIDGFRCDVAGFVPVDFWNTVRIELDKVKPVFMLAEWESRDLHEHAFDMTYAWSWSEYMHKVVRGEADMPLLFKYYSWNESAYPREAYRMTHVANHDTNAWEGTMFENYGDALETVIALSVIGEGVPMMYNGQEAGNDRRLKFFEKDPIEWKEHPIGDLYKALFALKHENTALWNGQYGARMIHVPNDNPKRVLSFVRENETDKVFAVFNFSDVAREVKFQEKLYHGSYKDAFSGDEAIMSTDSSVTLPAWGFKVFVK